MVKDKNKSCNGRKCFLIQIYINLLKKFFLISLNNIQVEKASYQKQLILFLDEKLTFKYHIDNTLCKFNKGITAIKKDICLFDIYTYTYIYLIDNKKACFTSKIFTHYSQSIFEASNRLRKYHL